MMNVNAKQLRDIDLNKINTDNIRVYEYLVKNKGKIVSLDYRNYIEFCNEFNIFYTLS